MYTIEEYFYKYGAYKALKLYHSAMVIRSMNDDFTRADYEKIRERKGADTMLSFDTLIDPWMRIQLIEKTKVEFFEITKGDKTFQASRFYYTPKREVISKITNSYIIHYCKSILFDQMHEAKRKYEKLSHILNV